VVPSYYKGRRSYCFWVDEDLFIELDRVVEEMGYRSLSEFYRELTREIVASYKAVRKFGLRGQEAKPFVFEYVKEKLLGMLKAKKRRTQR